MNIEAFRTLFEQTFPEEERDAPSPVLEQAFTRSFFDPCFFVPGMTAVKNQHLLKLAFSFIAESECYLEVGTWQGKTLISALLSNVPRKAYACDDFSEFTHDKRVSRDALFSHLRLFNLEGKVTFYNDDFRNVLNRDHIAEPVGVYFYDGGHTVRDHVDAIAFAEPILADRALVIIDDWNFEDVPRGTERAIAASKHTWEPLYLLPARGNADQGLWWNGVAVYTFTRRPDQDETR